MAQARDEYFVQVYRQLRQAARNARSANPQQTMNTTALVNEAWLKLEQADADANDRMHYLKTAALAMRQLLVDYARYRGAEKRDRAMELPLLEDLLPGTDHESADDVLALETPWVNSRRSIPAPRKSSCCVSSAAPRSRKPPSS
jgi:RNA polymerase sigma factor (TIGR02999 family)